MTAIHQEAHRKLSALSETLLGASGINSELWLVGGMVRDALVGRPLLDWDLVVSGDCAIVAKSIGKKFKGDVFQLSDRFGCWRVHANVDNQRIQIDVCSLRGDSIEADLLQRDFTVNAIAFSCWNERQFIDPHDGRGDLKRSQLRSVSDTVFTDDPLRLLRSARIAHDFGLDIDDATRALIKASAHLASEPSGERIFSELCLLVESAECRRALRLLADIGVLDVVLPELAACREVGQSHFHHLDVYEHTLAVLDNVEDIAETLEFYLPVDPRSNACEFDADAKRIMRFAAICHDLAKPVVRTVHPESGRVGFLGHDKSGVMIVNEMCDRWSTSNRFRDGVAHLVRTHLNLGILLHAPLDARASYRFRRSVQPWCAEAIVLSVADRMATAGVADRRRWARRHVEVARDLWRDYWREIQDGIAEPLLDGAEIAEVCNLDPGPEIGRFVRLLAEEQAVGNIDTHDKAVTFLRAQAEKSVSERLPQSQPSTEE